MPLSQSSIQTIKEKSNQFILRAYLYASIKPDDNLDTMTKHALKSMKGKEKFFTEITLRGMRTTGQMTVDFSITASSPASAERAGIVYLGQLSDILSSITREPVRFLMPRENAHEDRRFYNRTSTHIDRVLTLEEWNWIIESLVPLRQKHPRYLAAASWYRKGLCGIDPLEIVCCYWRVVERLSLSYCTKGKLPKDNDGKPICSAKNCVRQFIEERGLTGISNGVLDEDENLKKIVKLRNDISHGNEPITPILIEEASSLVRSLEEVAYECLAVIRDTFNQSESLQSRVPLYRT